MDGWVGGWMEPQRGVTRNMGVKRRGMDSLAGGVESSRHGMAWKRNIFSTEILVFQFLVPQYFALLDTVSNIHPTLPPAAPFIQVYPKFKKYILPAL